jgi:hypothetical protein
LRAAHLAPIGGAATRRSTRQFLRQQLGGKVGGQRREARSSVRAWRIRTQAADAVIERYHCGDAHTLAPDRPAALGHALSSHRRTHMFSGSLASAYVI